MGKVYAEQPIKQIKINSVMESREGKKEEEKGREKGGREKKEGRMEKGGEERKRSGILSK